MQIYTYSLFQCSISVHVREMVRNMIAYLGYVCFNSNPYGLNGIVLVSIPSKSKSLSIYTNPYKLEIIEQTLGWYCFVRRCICICMI